MTESNSQPDQRSSTLVEENSPAVDSPHDPELREIEESEAVAFWLSHHHCVIVWRDGPQRLKPTDPAKRIRDLRPGDEVLWEEQTREVLGMCVYR